MYLRGVHLRDLDWAFLERCSDEQVEESRIFDFKTERPDLDAPATRPRRDLVEDICAFANTGGGVVLYGVDELEDEQGRRGSRMGGLVGVPLADFDRYRDRIYEIVRGAMEPRFDQFQVRDIRRVPRDDAGIIAVGVEHSIRAPHRVKVYDSFQFMNRTMRTVERMDVEQIREAFRRSFESIQDAGERLTSAEDRMRGARPFFEETATLWATIIPATRDALPFPIRHDRVREALESQRDSRPRTITGGSIRYDARGAVLWSDYGTVPLDRVGRDGSVERIELIPTDVSAARLSEVGLTRSLFRTFAAFQQIREILGIVGPSLISFGLIAGETCKLFQVAPRQQLGGVWMYPQDDAHDLPTGILFTRAETSDDTFGMTLKRVADFFWQTANHRECAAFDDEGNPTEAFPRD